MIATITLLVLGALRYLTNKALDWHFDRKYRAHVIQFYDDTFGVRRLWVGGGYEFLGSWPSVPGATWWYQSAGHERVYHFRSKEEAAEAIVSMKAEEAKRDLERKRPGGRRV